MGELAVCEGLGAWPAAITGLRGSPPGHGWGLRGLHMLLERTAVIAVLTHCLPGVAVEPEGRCGVGLPTGTAFRGSAVLFLVVWGPYC